MKNSPVPHTIARFVGTELVIAGYNKNDPEYQYYQDTPYSMSRHCNFYDELDRLWKPPRSIDQNMCLGEAIFPSIGFRDWEARLDERPATLPTHQLMIELITNYPNEDTEYFPRLALPNYVLRLTDRFRVYGRLDISNDCREISFFSPHLVDRNHELWT